MKFILHFIPIALLALLMVVEGSHSPLEYDFSTSLHPSYNLYWNNPTDGKICMAVQVDTLGWVGLGFSPNGGMIGSDIMMAWVVDGHAIITDRFAEQESLPVLDNEQDFQLISGYEENGKTTIEFCRQLLTCDERDAEIVFGAVKLIYSWNDNDPINQVPLKHITRGVKSVKLIGTRKEFPAALEDSQKIEFRMGNTTIPNTDTTIYWCKTIHFVQPATKHHVIKFGAYIDPRNVELIHHMIMYRCTSTYPAMDGNCNDYDGIIRTSGAFDDCQSWIIGAWAVGARDLDFPLDAGFPIGPSETFDTILIEVHYDNPQLKAGIVDDSGLKWYYTDSLRTHDTGIMIIGHLVNSAMRIPPQTESFVINGYCPGSCTRSKFTEPINVIASLPHSHTAGASMWTQIIRDNKEIGYLDLNLNYDFNFQDYILHEDPVVLLPGDELIFNCLYNTKSRSEFTHGGQSIQEEMCLNFLYYYPRMDIPNCGSTYNAATSFNAALDSFQCNNIDVNGSTTHEELVGRANNIEWTDKISRTLEISSILDSNKMKIHCGIDHPFDVTLPLPGVDYEEFPYRYDSCGNYNGTYYPGGHTADYYYDCTTNEPYYQPIGPTASAPSLLSLPVMMWLLTAAILSLL